MKFWYGPLCRNESGSFPLLNVGQYWNSSNTKACTKKLFQILANNIDKGEGGLVSEFCEVLQAIEPGTPGPIPFTYFDMLLRRENGTDRQ